MTEQAETAHPWEDKELLVKVVEYLRGSKGMPVRHGIELERRVDYFRGDRLVKFMMDHNGKGPARQDIKKKEEGLLFGFFLLKNQFIHRVQRDDNKKSMLRPHPQQAFTLDGYYVWMVEGSKTTRNFMTTALIIGFVFITMFPAWPMWMKTVLWYISVTILCFIILLVAVRLFFFYIFWMFGYDCWFLPNLFDETLSVADSFRPIVSWEAGSPSERYWRMGVIAFTAGLLWWIGQQPHDIDEYMSITRQFTEDLYSGKLLSDVSENPLPETQKKKMPSLEDLLAEENHDIFSERDDEAIIEEYFEQQLEKLTEEEDEGDDEHDGKKHADDEDEE